MKQSAECPQCGSDNLDWLDEWEEPVGVDDDDESVVTVVEYTCNDCMTIFTDNE